MEFNKILIAIDSKPSAMIIAQSGLQLAKQFNAEIALVSIIDPNWPIDDDSATPGELADMMEHNLNRIQNNVIDNIFKKFPAKSFVETGTPYKVIIETAEKWGANIIVMGTHGRKGLPHLLLGSVAENVIRHSKKSVIVIPVND